MNSTVQTILTKYEDAVATLGFQLRDYLLNELKDVTETPDYAANLIAYSYGPGYKGMICTILPSKKGIKLGLYKGSELPDPGRLLVGSGKIHRFVEIKSDKDLLEPALKELLLVAVEAFHKRNI